jgi:hypothetical protein
LANGYGEALKLTTAFRYFEYGVTAGFAVAEAARFLGFAKSSDNQSRHPYRKKRGQGGVPTIFTSVIVRTRVIERLLAAPGPRTYLLD